MYSRISGGEQACPYLRPLESLSRIDKKIPLHIEHLSFTEQYIYVNDTRIELHSDFDLGNEREEVLVNGAFRHWDQVRTPGDVCMRGEEFHELSNTENLEIRNQKPFELNFAALGSTAERRVSPDIPKRIAMKKAAALLFRGRCSIYVSELAVCRLPILRLPLGFNIRVRSSLDAGRDNLNDIIRIIDPQRFPLKAITFCPRTPELYYHPIVQTAETLITSVDRSEFLQQHSLREILTFPHKHITVVFMNPDYEAMKDVVQNWLDHPREHGKTFIMWESSGGMIKSMYRLKKQFNGNVVLIPKNNNKRAYPKAVIIPINSNSELLISCVRDEEIKLESVPTGTIQSTVPDDLTYHGVLWSHWSRVQERFEEDERLAPIIIISAGLVFCFAVLFYILYE